MQWCWHWLEQCKLCHLLWDFQCNWPLCWPAMFCLFVWQLRLCLAPRNNIQCWKRQLDSTQCLPHNWLCHMVCLRQHKLKAELGWLPIDTHLLCCPGTLGPNDDLHTQCHLDWGQWISLCWYPTMSRPHNQRPKWCREHLQDLHCNWLG